MIQMKLELGLLILFPVGVEEEQKATVWTSLLLASSINHLILCTKKFIFNYMFHREL